MNVWQYRAIRRGPAEPKAQQGELAGESAADVRAALRRAGLQVLDLRPIRRDAVSQWSRWNWLLGALRGSVHGYLRRRRQAWRADFYDGVATMLQSGIPLIEATETMASSSPNRSSARAMLVELRQQLRSGFALDQAMAHAPAWFDQTEVAMVAAGQHGGTLASVLEMLSNRHQRATALTGSLLSALAYPLVVFMVGLGVVIFLSVETLPDLAFILTRAGIETPNLTAKVMAIGRFITGSWPALAVALPAGIIVALGFGPVLARRPQFDWLRRLQPRLLRRLTVARFSQQLAEMLQSGVSMVEALRVLAPTMSGYSGDFSSVLIGAANRLEHGDEFSATLDSPRWFDAEFRRLLEVGQSSGELDELLTKIAERYNRQSQRAIDRLASLLEPAVILLLAALVGMVVMSAILPLLRLQEIL